MRIAEQLIFDRLDNLIQWSYNKLLVLRYGKIRYDETYGFLVAGIKMSHYKEKRKNRIVNSYRRSKKYGKVVNLKRDLKWQILKSI